jgi:UDP-N-acetylglucosamine diphosphorylase/glucosamine-1-phosphate N-acetyltransferase
MTDLYFYDDATARALEPFALTRPGCELRAGALLVRERWEHALRLHTAGFVSAPHLKDFDENGAAHSGSGRIKAGTVLVNARCAVALAPLAAADTWTVDDRVAAVTLPRDVDVAELASGTASLESLARDGGTTVAGAGRWIENVWDFIAHLQAMLVEDVSAIAAKGQGLVASVAGRPPLVYTEEGATVEPHVFFDTSAGPVLVRRGAIVQAFTRVVGPCVIGVDSTVGGDRISGCSIGDSCRVHGELSASIILGHSNKSHDGFVGHSYLGRWVNLGAGTTTSNLKNTYGTVSLWTPGGEQNTGLRFLGTFFGDHAKTGIGTQLTTGTVIGAGANVFGGATPPRAVEPFAWGDGAPYTTFRLDKFLEVAGRVMERRQVSLSDGQARQLAAAHKLRWPKGLKGTKGTKGKSR